MVYDYLEVMLLLDLDFNKLLRVDKFYHFPFFIQLIHIFKWIKNYIGNYYDYGWIKNLTEFFPPFKS